LKQIIISDQKCDGCGLCQAGCPFGAVDLHGGKAQLNAACKACGLCIKRCPKQAIVRLKARSQAVDKTLWRDILVVGEVSGGRLHPVTLELIGKAQELAEPTGYQVNAVLIGDDLTACAQELRHYRVSEIAVYNDRALSFFRADAYAACAEDYIRFTRPSVVLVGATSLGRSLAPRLATRFHTGLTADCTSLEMRDTDLVQIRPAFGGNIMAQIVTQHTRPQFATVRYKVMTAPARRENASGVMLSRAIPKGVVQSRIRHVRTVPIPPAASISDAEVLVVGGRGLCKEADLEMIRELARLLGGDWAVSRPLAEKGWAPAARQIGLSGRTVRPRLLITCGVSGAIQFTSCMNGSERIVAVNTDPNAPIFNVAHIAIVGDLYQIVPDLLKEARHETV